MFVVGAGREEGTGFAQGGEDGAVGGVELGVDDGAFAAQPWPVGAVFAVALYREDGGEGQVGGAEGGGVSLAQGKVVLAVVRGHVDEAGAAVGGDEVAGQEMAGRGEEAAEGVHGVAGGGAGEVSAVDAYVLALEVTINWSPADALAEIVEPIDGY